jgi:hypothetical protein
LGRLVTQDKDLEALGGVTAGELGKGLDGAAHGQVGRWCTPRSMRTTSSWALSEDPHPTDVPDADQPVGVLALCVERVGGDHRVGEVHPSSSGRNRAISLVVVHRSRLGWARTAPVV